MVQSCLSLIGPIRNTLFFGPIFTFLYLDQYEVRSSLVQFSFFFIWTITKFVLPWSNDFFSSFGPIRSSFFFGPIITFLYLDQYRIHSSLVQWSLFFVWTNTEYILLWSDYHFSLFGPIRSPFFFGPIITSLYLDQIPLPQHKKAPRGRRLFIGLLIV